MKTRYWLLTAAVLTMSIGTAHAQSAKEAVEAAAKTFTEAYNGKNATDLAEHYTKDASTFPPDMARVDGRDNIEKMWQGAMDLGVTDFALTPKEVEEDGNLAYESGTFTLKAPGKDGKPADFTGKYVVVWVKRDTWKMYRDIWNFDPAKK
jgi:ketosteroid isomerase-like protein